MRILHVLVVSVFLASVTACTSSTITTPPGPSPGQVSQTVNPIKHIIILVQQDRSMNSLFMGFPRANTVNSGPCRPYNPPPQYHEKEICPNGGPVKLHPIPLEANAQLGGESIDKYYSTFISEYDAGKMDGFDTDYTAGGPARLYPYAFVERREVQPYWDMASQYALGDRMFSTEKSDDFPAFQELIAGTTTLNDRESIVNNPQNALIWGCDAAPGARTSVLFKNGRVSPNGGPFPCYTQYKTIADSLDTGDVSWRYYVEAMSGKYRDFSGGVWNAFDAIKSVRYGPDWKNIVNPNTQVLNDAADGKLPGVSYVIPSLLNSDSPGSGCGNGPNWVTRVVDAIGKGPDWNSTAIIVTWDDWGGWYDNVPPPQLDYVSLGMRVPLIVISPFAKKHYVSSTQYEFGSLLKFIEQTFGTASLGSTDVRANSIADMFDFDQKPSAFKPIPVPPAKKCGTDDPR